jgi:hypothetical protein
VEGDDDGGGGDDRVDSSWIGFRVGASEGCTGGVHCDFCERRRRDVVYE